ncbi:NAD(P)H-dependent oxidoreductase [Zhongshania sp.]|jgi:NAD(P)H dehydrogenase (quinone)|uniref:NAD(P)H-dependent oxidoreductase n=1 Tax=Zhongshania sp. TaxID=1971902 RepID=UPI0039E37A2A
MSSSAFMAMVVWQVKKALVSVSTGGRDDMLSEGGIHSDINEILKPLSHGSLGYVGIDVLKPFHAFHAPYVSAEACLEILDKWRSELANLDERKCLARPDFSKFDEYFFPIT